MTLADTVSLKVRQLPPDRQLQVLKFVESLERPSQPAAQRRSSKGALSDLGRFDLSLEDFEAARREAWKNFPREFPS